MLNLLWCFTAHGISLTSWSHVTTTVWLSDRHLSLLPRRYSRQRESPRRLQSRPLRQHGRPTDALPTGRPGSTRPRMHTRTCVTAKQGLLGWMHDQSASFKAETWPESRWKWVRALIFCAIEGKMCSLSWISWAWRPSERLCVFVWCVFVTGVGGGGGIPQSSEHLSPLWSGSGCMGRKGVPTCCPAPVCLRSLAAVLSAWPSCKCGGLIKPTARHTQAHKRGWWKWGMEWALMDIGIELHWQGWRLKAWIPRQTCRLRLKQAVGSTRRLCCYYNAVCNKPS